MFSHALIRGRRRILMLKASFVNLTIKIESKIQGL